MTEKKDVGDFEPRYHPELYEEFYAAVRGTEEAFDAVVLKIAKLPRAELTMFVAEILLGQPDRNLAILACGMLTGRMELLTREGLIDG